MAAPTIKQVMEGISTRLATITDLDTSGYTPNAAIFPCAFVGVPEISSYRETFTAGTFILRPTVTVLVSAAVDDEGQYKLAGYANPTGLSSIITAIEGDMTLGGIVDQCVVDGFRPLGLEEIAGYGGYGGIFELRVYVEGN